MNKQHTELAIRDMQMEIGRWATEKGWKKDIPRDPLHLLMLVTSELGEATEAFRDGNPPSVKAQGYSCAEEELADAIIRILQMGDELDLDIAGALMAKLEYNWGRPYMHGRKM